MQDSLRSLLHEWTVHPSSNPNFRTEVWRRIEARRQRLAFRLWSRTEALIGQPLWATTAIACMLVLGITTGNTWREHAQQQAQRAGLTAYVLAVNPVAHAVALER
jgi:hypothetical protein